MKLNRITALTAVLTFLVLSATALAITPTKIQSDLLQIGRGASSSDKTLEVNSNQGANNVKLVVPVATPLQLNVTTDTLKVGKSTAADKKIILDANAGAANPAIKWDNAAAKLQFANNGVDFKSFGSGSGGGGGVNLIQDFNPDFEGGTTNWSASGGSFTVATSGSNLLFGTRSGVFNASAAAQTLLSTAITVTGAPAPGLAGANGEVSCFFKTTATDYKLQAWDGSNVLAERTIGASTYAVEQGASFPIPAAGTIAVRIISASDATDLSVDDCYLGSLRTKSVAQSRIVGEAQIPATASCSWQRTNTALGAFTTDADCPGPTVITNPGVCQIQTTDSDLPRVTCTNAPPGTYTVHARFTSSFTVTTALVQYALSDGTSTRGATTWRAGNGSDLQAMAVSGTWTYTDGGTRSWDVYGAADSGVVEITNTADSRNLTFTIHYSPSAEQQALTFAQVANSWSGFHANDCSFARTNTAYGAPTDDASCTFTERTNTNFGTVTSAGSKTSGIVFTPSRVGKYEVCAFFPSLQGSANAQAGFLLTDGTTTVWEVGNQDSAATTTTRTGACGQYRATTVAAKTLTIQSKVSAGTVTIAAPGTEPAIEWAIRQIDVQEPAPLIVGGVVSPSSGVEKVTALRVTNAGTPTILRQSGNWVTSLTDSAVGITIVNIAAGTFSGEPSCACTAITAGTNNRECMFQSISSSAINVRTSNGAADLDIDFSIVCSGPS